MTSLSNKIEPLENYMLDISLYGSNAQKELEKLENYIIDKSYKHYPNIGLSIVKSFISIMICSKHCIINEYIISEKDLVLWNILSENKDIKQLFEKNKLIENKDYKSYTTPAKYYLTFISFKQCLYFSESKYKNYFIALEHYYDYYTQSELTKAHEKIEQTEKTICFIAINLAAIIVSITIVHKCLNNTSSSTNSSLFGRITKALCIST